MRSKSIIPARPCAHCSEEFTPKQCQLDRGGGKYCSYPCYWAEKRQYQYNDVCRAPRTLRICAECGKEFLALVKQVRDGKGQYCSRLCAQQVNRNRVTIRCAICSAPFESWPSRLKRGGGRYCSAACRVVGVRKANYWGRKGKMYQEWRLAVIRRDNSRCRQCGAQGAGVVLHTHHIKPWAYYHKLRFLVSNGLTLCEPCHRALHSGHQSPPAITSGSSAA